MSNPEFQPALAKFLETAERLKALLGDYGAVKQARNMPAKAAMVFDQMIEFRVHHSRDADDSRAAMQAADEVKVRCKAEAYAAAEGLRDKCLLDIANELMQIRSALPSITTQLAIELGVTSRQLTHEAEHASS